MVGENEEKKAEREKKRLQLILSKKKELIMHFPIPNTKEDILEFLMLAKPLATSSDEEDQAISDIWMKKCEQIVMKAKLSMTNDKSSLQIIGDLFEELISHKKKDLKKRKIKFILPIIGAIVFFIVIGVGAWISESNGTSEIKTEETRLENVENEIIKDIKEKKFEDATLLLNQLDWTVTENRGKNFITDLMKDRDKYQDKRDFWKNKKTELETSIEENKKQKQHGSIRK